MLRVIDLSKDYGERMLFDSACFSVSAGEKIGIVGPNGCGKTTLLRIIAGNTQADRGAVHFTGAPSIALLPQHVLDFGRITVGELLAPGFIRASAALTDGQEQMARHPQDAALLAAYEQAYERFEAEGGYAFDARLDVLLGELAMSSVDLGRPLQSLSGGQLTKLALARVLLQDADLLLLDEPTNNLDLASLAWLEKSLLACRSACLIVSHDRRFLDRVTSRTLVVDPPTAAVTDYSGNYSWYCLRWSQDIARQLREYEVQQRKIRRLTADIREVKQQAVNTEKSTQDDFIRGRAKKVAAKAKAREHRLTRLIEQESIEKPRAVQQMRLHLGGRPQYDSVLVAARDVRIDFATTTFLDAINFELVGSARILLSGDNGSGKSTLLKLIVGQLPPSAGCITRKPTLSACYLPQQQENLPGDATVMDFFRSQLCIDRNSWRDGDIRTFLHRFQFAGEQVFEPIARLSRGERTKLLLSTFMARNPDLLILDEPTNHLDLPTVELLESALSQFKGALLVVSHDRYFIDRVQPHYNWHLTAGTLDTSSTKTSQNIPSKFQNF